MRYYNKSMDNLNNRNRSRRSKMNEYENEEVFSDDIDENMECSYEEYYEEMCIRDRLLVVNY